MRIARIVCSLPVHCLSGGALRSLTTILVNRLASWLAGWAVWALLGSNGLPWALMGEALMGPPGP